MQQRPRAHRAVALGVAAAISAGAVAVPVLAQGSTGTSRITTTAATQVTSPMHRAPGATRAQYQAALAKQLGISQTTLQAAESTAHESVLLGNLAQLVKSGRITQAQATALKQAAANGTFDAVLKQQRLARLQTRLARAVKNGRITQAQADRRLTNATKAPANG